MQMLILANTVVIEMVEIKPSPLKRKGRHPLALLRVLHWLNVVVGLSMALGEII